MVLAWATLSSAIAKENATLATKITFKDKGDGLVELIYTGKEQEKLTIQIFGDKQKPVHKETVRSEYGFKKPFNFRQMPYGQYTFEISTKEEKVVHKVNYKAPTYPGNVKVMFDPQGDDKFKYLVLGPNEKKMTLFVYDDQDRVIMKESIHTANNFGKVYAFKRSRSKSLEFVLIDGDQVIHKKKVRL